MKPTLLIRLEHFAIFLLALFGYYSAGFAWWALIVFFLVPDISMLGYLIDSYTGSLVYNLGHLYIWPIVLSGLHILTDNPLLLQVALIWLVHISIDRVVGYGLKYPTDFKDTTAQRLDN